MARSRTEFKTQVNNLISAIVNITKHRQVLNDELADSINFRKDVKSSTAVPVVSNISIDFTTSDLITIDAATNNLDLNITILNTEDGEDSKYIRVIKDSGKRVEFTGTTDISYSDNITQTEIVYQVYNKNGSIFACALGGRTFQKIYEVTGWNMDTNATYTVTNDILPAYIRSVECVMNNGILYYDLKSAGKIGSIGLPNLILERDAGGTFDSAAFNNADGRVTIEYELVL